jgi:hypothetical protein
MSGTSSATSLTANGMVVPSLTADGVLSAASVQTPGANLTVSGCQTAFEFLDALKICPLRLTGDPPGTATPTYIYEKRLMTILDVDKKGLDACITASPRNNWEFAFNKVQVW